jgi:hypothetical protein
VVRNEELVSLAMSSVALSRGSIGTVVVVGPASWGASLVVSSASDFANALLCVAATVPGACTGGSVEKSSPTFTVREAKPVAPSDGTSAIFDAASSCCSLVSSCKRMACFVLFLLQSIVRWSCWYQQRQHVTSACKQTSKCSGVLVKGPVEWIVPLQVWKVGEGGVRDLWHHLGCVPSLQQLHQSPSSPLHPLGSGS